MAWPSSFTTPPAGSGPQGHNDAHSELIAAVQDLDSRVNSGVTDHDDLTGRDAADQHPIGAVTGLQSALDDKANTSALGSAAFAPTSAFDPAGAASSAVSAFAGTLGTAAGADTGDFATATQGAKADSAVQPADLTPYATDADLSTHASDTTAVHGIADTSALVTDDDSRLSDARTPTAHAASHADGGADEVSIHASQVTDGVFNIARLATGTPDGTKFIRDDGTLAVPAGGGLSGVGVSTVWAGSQAAYDAIGTPDPNTLYFVTG